MNEFRTFPEILPVLFLSLSTRLFLSLYCTLTNSETVSDVTK